MLGRVFMLNGKLLKSLTIPLNPPPIAPSPRSVFVQIHFNHTLEYAWRIIVRELKIIHTIQEQRIFHLCHRTMAAIAQVVRNFGL